MGTLLKAVDCVRDQCAGNSEMSVDDCHGSECHVARQPCVAVKTTIINCRRTSHRPQSVYTLCECWRHCQCYERLDGRHVYSITVHHHHHHHYICPIIQQYAHLREYDSRRAGQQGPIRTLTAALKRPIKTVTGCIVYHTNKNITNEKN